jgi:GAF domain
MRATTVRFSEDLWELLEAESAKQGISAAQFVRDAAMMRLGTLSSRRGDAAATLTLEALAAGALTRRPAEPDAVLADPARIDALGRTGLLDSPPDEAFDRLTAMAARLLDAPVALISLVDEDRQFFKSCTGLGEPWSTRRETPLSHSFCQYALESAEPLIIDDARTHPLVRENLAIRDLDVVAYAGVPLITPAGHTIGALCAIDHQAREWTSEQIETLQVIAAAVISEIERTPAST